MTVASDFTVRTLQAYERWAPAYPPTAHNPLMRAEQEAMLRMQPAVAGRRVLDLACGSGRYAHLLIEAQAAEVIAVDFCLPMLRQVGGAQRVCASMMGLPFVAATFDVVISGLALGHATDLVPWADEVARVLRDRGTLLYSDFHPEAARAGLPRTFKDANNQVFAVPHHCFDLDAQFGALQAAGFDIEAVETVRVGYELQESFTNSDAFYDRWHGLPLVLVVRARK
jgi:ubiquinone/menaquinone biosynthesis C-methylase UbiE